MFQTGEYIIYGSSGICQVTDVGPLKDNVSFPDRLYYTLKPIFGTETIYTPVDTSVFMRPIMSKEEALELIEQIPSIEEEDCSKQTVSQLKEYYSSSFQSHECEDLVQLIKSIYAKNKLTVDQGKKVSALDQQYISRAEELLHGELSVALDIPYDDVLDYIKNNVPDVEEQQ